MDPDVAAVEIISYKFAPAGEACVTVRIPDGGKTIFDGNLLESARAELARAGRWREGCPISESLENLWNQSGIPISVGSAEGTHVASRPVGIGAVRVASVDAA